jgi:hypothetical protein
MSKGKGTLWNHKFVTRRAEIYKSQVQHLILWCVEWKIISFKQRNTLWRNHEQLKHDCECQKLTWHCKELTVWFEVLIISYIYLEIHRIVLQTSFLLLTTDYYWKNDASFKHHTDSWTSVDHKYLDGLDQGLKQKQSITPLKALKCQTFWLHFKYLRMFPHSKLNLRRSAWILYQQNTESSLFLARGGAWEWQSVRN